MCEINFLIIIFAIKLKYKNKYNDQMRIFKFNRYLIIIFVIKQESKLYSRRISDY